MKLLVLTQNYVPDLAASSFRMKSLVEALAESGHTVTVLAGSPNRYRSYKVSAGVAEASDLSSEDVIWIKRPVQRGGVFLRSVGDAVFLIKGMFKATSVVRKVDGIVATTPHLWMALIGAFLAKITGKPLVLDVRDLWPDVMPEMGLLKASSPVFRLLKKIEKFSYEHASIIVVNSPRFEKPIRTMVKKEISVITNGIENSFFQQLSALRSTPLQHGKPLVVTYAGNLGMAQGLDLILGQAGRFQGQVEFHLIGDGSGRSDIQELVDSMGIANVFFHDPVARDDLLAFYRKTDAFLVHLRDIPMFRKTIPSKIFEYVATGKPVIYGLTGVARELMEGFQGDRFSFVPDDAGSFANTIESLLLWFKNEGGSSWDGSRGQAMIESEFLREDLSRKFARLIQERVSYVAENDGSEILGSSASVHRPL